MGARLRKNDWIEFGLKELSKNGHKDLKAQTLAAKLGVSRGSFYWHFEDIAEFEASVIALWRSRATDKILESLDQSIDPKDRLQQLIELALKPADMERAIRSWSVTSPMVSEAVAEVDNRRFEYIEGTLKDIGVNSSDIRYRALILYWAGIGRTIIENQKLRSMSPQNVKSLVSLMSS